MTDQRSILLLSDFNAANFARYLATEPRAPEVRVRVGPMERSVGLFRQPAEPLDAAEDVIVWTQPHRVSAAFASMLDGDPADVQAILASVDEFARGVAGVARSAPAVFVPTWVMPHDHRGFGLLAMRESTGPSNALLRMNLRLSEQLTECPNVYILDSQRWMIAAGPDAYNHRLWHMGKIPFGNAVFKAAAGEVKAAMRAIAGDIRKLIVVDLDGTLWGGVLGDVGWEQLRLGGHDAVGEAFAAFQRGLKSLTRRGIVLGIVSKNDEQNAVDAIARHPEMVLRAADFAGWRINWEDKAANVAALTAELNLGLESVVFIDDHPGERDRVRAALPEVLVPEWPASPVLFPSALAALDCFDTPAVTTEDRHRQAAYRAGLARAAEAKVAGSLEAWLHGLELEVQVSDLSDANAVRVTQLLNKTNQMNLSTRRLSAPEVKAWASAPHHKMWAFRVIDKFEDAGLTGIVSVAIEHDEARIVDFVMSCRVMGRQVEHAMLFQAAQYASERGMTMLSAHYLPTPRNGPCRHFLESSGFENGNGHTFRWDLRRPYQAPRHIALRTYAPQ